MMAKLVGITPPVNKRSHRMQKPTQLRKNIREIEKDLTQHAWRRMTARGLSLTAVQAALEYGRVAYVRGAAIFAIGRKEVKRFAMQGVDLSHYEGIQVVCAPEGTILTAYRNHDFRGLRPFRRHFKSAA